MYKIQTQFSNHSWIDWGWRSWYERVKTGPSPEDNALLQLTRELSVQFQMPYWYKQIVWGRLDRYQSTGRMISKPTILSGETVTVPGSLPETELMLPEYLKGELSLDEWKILIALHMVRFKAYKKGRMNRLVGKIALAPADYSSFCYSTSLLPPPGDCRVRFLFSRVPYFFSPHSGSGDH